MTKFKLHLIDDEPKFISLVKEAILGDEDIFDELIDFEYFQTIGSAREYYQQSANNHPDIALVDINFTDREIPETEKGELKGFELIQYLIEESPSTRTFAFSGYADLDDVAKRLNELNLFENLINKGRREQSKRRLSANEPTDQSELGAQVKVRILNCLQNLAIQIIQKLPQHYRNNLQTATSEQVPGTDFTLACLLVGWGDISNETHTEIQAILTQILHRGARNVTFRGNWNRMDSKERVALKYYHQLPVLKYNTTAKRINQKAFDLLLEFIRINKECIDFKGNHFTAELSEDFRNFGVIGDNFENKQIARGTMLAFDTYLDRRKGLSLDEFAFLLRDTQLTENDEDNPSPRHPVFNTHLGIAVGQNGVIKTDEEYLLPEEILFNNKYGCFAASVANFLDDIRVPNLLRQLLDGDFLNMSALKRYLDRVNGNYPELFEEEKKRLFNDTNLRLVPINNRYEIFNLYGINIP